MRILEGKDYEEVSVMAADVLTKILKEKSNPVLGLATGSTPIGTYKELINRYEAGELDFSNVSTVNLDEYKDMEASNDQSYRYFMNDNLFKHVNIDITRTHVPNGMDPEEEKVCKDYDTLIKSLGGADIQVLGIGGNGHIGFNEPSDHFEKGTHCVSLAKDTIEANARFFNSIEEVPTKAYTMGIENIMSAKKILLIATGEGKAEALYQSLFGPIVPNVQASILQLHQDVTVIADGEALKLIKSAGKL